MQFSLVVTLPYNWKCVLKICGLNFVIIAVTLNYVLISDFSHGFMIEQCNVDTLDNTMVKIFFHIRQNLAAVRSIFEENGQNVDPKL